MSEHKEKSKTIQALEHALNRLNNLPHKYSETDFKLLEAALVEEYNKDKIEPNEWLSYLKGR